MRHQPNVVCQQEHNQHAMVGEVTSFGRYDMLYSSAFDYSSLCILVRHDLQHLVAYNDPQGRWMVVQLCIHGEIYEFAAVYA